MALIAKLASLLRHTSMEPGTMKHSFNCKKLVLPAALFAVSRGMSSSKLFIGGLSWGTDEKTLKEAFSSFGVVTEARIITDRETGRSRGFGFVNFSSEQDAEEALRGMDGQDLAGRTLRVNYATDRVTGGFGGASSGGMSRGFSGGFGAGGRGGRDTSE
ncbi:hypothetical protein O6H91_Y497200 [Diphasiastrum complanatum]|nr:hypothetical protein O6H91_Y497200 [Diphasiastrum complanatum]